MVITATILLLKRYAQEYDQTAVSLGFSEHLSLYRISIMGVLYRYYHLFSQNFTGRHNSALLSDSSANANPNYILSSCFNVLSVHCL